MEEGEICAFAQIPDSGELPPFYERVVIYDVAFSRAAKL